MDSDLYHQGVLYPTGKYMKHDNSVIVSKSGTVYGTYNEYKKGATSKTEAKLDFISDSEKSEDEDMDEQSDSDQEMDSVESDNNINSSDEEEK